MRRFPISLKLILAALALVAALTVAFMWIATDVLRGVYNDQADRLRQERVTELERRSVSVAAHIAETAREALAGNETGRLQRVLRGIAEGAPDIRYAAIADETGRVLVRSDMLVLDSLRQDRHFVQTDEAGPLVAERRHNDEAVREVTYPIRVRQRGGKPLGYLQIAWSLRELEIGLDAVEAEKERNLGRATTLMVVSSFIAVGAGILAGILGGMGLARPIRRLAQTARSIAKGDIAARSAVSTRDEIGELATTMNYMAGKIGELLDETKKSAELEQELAVARSIQQGLIPGRGVIRQPGLHIVGLVEPASHCGGDWWAYLRLTRQRTLVLVADVTGHGISSAMLTATARSCLDTVRQLTRGDFRVGYLLKVMDQLIRESIGDEFHMTCFASILDPLEGTMTYANAGHNHPFLFRHTPDGWRQGRLAARGNRLGDADGHAFVEHTIATSPKDLLCWYTDGLVETADAKGREFGVRRLRAALSRGAGDPPDRILEHIMQAFDEHRAGAPLTDDVTCVVGRVLG